MKRSLVTLFATLSLVALGAAGCANLSRQSSAHTRQPHTFALAVTVDGVLQPTPAQWAVIQAKVADVLAQQGAVLVTDLALAERILRIDFTPNPLDPENSGHAVLLGVRNNPRYGYASTSFGSFPTSFGYQGTFQNALGGFGQGYGFGYGYGYGYGGYSPYGYGWNDSYYDGYSYGSGNLSPIAPPVPTKPTLPPQRTHPHERPACPPPSDTYVRTLPTRFPGEYALNQPADHPRSAPGEHRHWRGGDDSPSTPSATSSYARGYTSWRGDRSSTASDSSGSRSDRYARSDSSGSRSERTYARSDSSGSRSDRGNWRSERTYSRSDSSPSYSRSDSSSSYSRSESSYSPSYSSSSSSYSSSDSSSSSSYSGGSSSSFSGSGGGSSGGASTAVEPTSTRNQN